MMRRLPLALLGTFATAMCAAVADDLDFEGHDLVEPDCNAMSSWFECRDIDTAPPEVFLGYLYMHHTSATLGPEGDTRYPDTLEPYVTTVTACSSCHFTGGHVPFGSPVYQSPSKYRPEGATGQGPYFRPLGYHRDLEDSIIDCFRNCMNAERAPEKEDPVMLALVEYVQWVAAGISDQAMREDWNLLPPEAGPRLPVIPGVSAMRADAGRGSMLYANQCADCHDEDGPGAGEYRSGEERPRVPALWGMQDGYTRGAAFYRTPVLAAYVQQHMPYDDPGSLSAQDALDIAAHINAPDKPRPAGMADLMYAHEDPDGIPSALRKPADWLVGAEYPGERATFEAQGVDYEDMVLFGPWEELQAWRATEVERLQGPAVTILGVCDGAGTSAPCGNTGSAGRGCENSTGSGAVLSAQGSASLLADDLTFVAEGLPGGQAALLFTGTTVLQGGDGLPLGAGLRVVGGATVRLGVQTSSMEGRASWGPGLATSAGWTAGRSGHLQVWYRDPVAGPCESLFNLTNGLSLSFTD